MLRRFLHLSHGHGCLLLRQTNASACLYGFGRQEFHFNRTLSVSEKKLDVVSADEDEMNVGKQRQNQNPFARETIADNREPLPPLARETTTSLNQDKLLKVLQLEADIAYQEGRRVPPLEFFSDEHWEHALTLTTKSARSKYYGYLWQLEKKKQSHDRKKAEKAAGVVERKAAKQKEREENNHIMYGLSDTSMFLRIYDSTINHWQNNRLTRAMQFAPKIVLDCSYDEHMNKREALNAAKQLMLCFADNRAHDDPLDLHYCNVNMKSICTQALHRYIPTMLNLEFPMNVHEQCFTKLFPRENLVYLTPHCRTDMHEYNPDDVYIIGAMVDKMNNEPLSLAKAKRLNLRMARLPLDQYLQWGAGSGKSLTLNQMVNILLDLKKTGNWNTALQHVPRRKVVDLEQEAFQQKKKMQKHAQRFNISIDKLLEYEKDESRVTQREVRSRKKDLEFNLDTWASGQNKNQNSQ